MFVSVVKHVTNLHQVIVMFCIIATAKTQRPHHCHLNFVNKKEEKRRRKVSKREDAKLVELMLEEKNETKQNNTKMSVNCKIVDRQRMPAMPK